MYFLPSAGVLPFCLHLPACLRLGIGCHRNAPQLGGSYVLASYRVSSLTACPAFSSAVHRFAETVYQELIAHVEPDFDELSYGHAERLHELALGGPFSTSPLEGGLSGIELYCEENPDPARKRLLEPASQEVNNQFNAVCFRRACRYCRASSPSCWMFTRARCFKCVTARFLKGFSARASRGHAGSSWHALQSRAAHGSFG